MDNLIHQQTSVCTRFQIFLLCLLLINEVFISGQITERDSLLAEFYIRRAEILYEKSEYDSLPFYYRNALNIFRRYSCKDRQVHCLLGLAEYYRIIFLSDSTLHYLDKAEELLDTKAHDNSNHIAELYYIRGKLLNQQGEYRKAIGNITLAMEKQEPGYEHRIARYLGYLGNVYLRMGNLDSAGIYYTKGYELISSLSAEPVIEQAWYFLNISSVYRARGDYDEVLRCLKENIRIYISIYGEEFPDLGNSYLSFAYYYYLTGLNDTARFYLDKAEKIILKDSISLANLFPVLYSYRGIINYSEGNYPEAGNDHQRALQAAIRVFGESNPELYSYYINFASLLRTLGDYNGALQYYQKSLEISEKLHTSRYVTTLHYLASIYSVMGEAGQAKYYFNRLITDRIKYFGPDHPLLAYDYISYRDFLIRSGDHKPIPEYLGKALEIRLKNPGPKHYQTAEVYYMIGEYFAREGNDSLALEYFQKALISVSESFDNPDIFANPDITGDVNLLILLQILKDKAMTLEHKVRNSAQGKKFEKYLQCAYNTYRLAADVISRMHNDFLTEESRLYLSENERGTYISLMEVALQLYDLTGDGKYLSAAFESAENLRYSTLLASLRDQRALETGDVPKELQVLDRQIRMELTAYKDLVSQEYEKENADSAKISNWNNKIYDLTSKRQGLIRQLAGKYPEYYSLKYHGNVPSAGDVRKKLARDEIIFEYVLSDSLLIVFLLDKSGIKYDHTVIDSSFFRDIEVVYDFIRNDYYYSNPDRIRAYVRSASSLYNILLGKYNIPDEKRLIIIPDGILSYIPYDALLYHPVDGNNSDFGKLPYAIRKYPMSYACSASLLYHSGRRKIGAGKGLLAFAPSDTGSTNIAGDLVRNIQIDRNSIEPLAGTEKEVRSIIDITGGDLRLGNEASEFSFKQLASKYRILHLAMHTFIDDDDPLYSKLVFSSSTDGNEDGLLNVFEIYNLNLNAGMVVLSACNTGYGILKKGEGIMSLARAFFYAGIPDIVMTLWTIVDESGGKLIVEFYKELFKGNPKDIALRNAKLLYLEEIDPIMKHPYYWSGYINVGNSSPVFVLRITRYLFPGLVVILALMGLLYINRLFKKSKMKK